VGHAPPREEETMLMDEDRCGLCRQIQIMWMDVGDNNYMQTL
jgi:hypothetical protein